MATIIESLNVSEQEWVDQFIRFGIVHEHTNTLINPLHDSADTLPCRQFVENNLIKKLGQAVFADTQDFAIKVGYSEQQFFEKFGNLILIF